MISADSHESAHVVLAHPERNSFNGLLADTTTSNLAEAGWHVSFADLYGMGFDPCEAPRHYSSRADTSRFHAQTEQRFNADEGSTPEEISEQIESLLSSDLLVVHFPLWWFGMPAILKGWIDRVFVYGSMYTSSMRYDSGICAGKKMIACVTTGASADSCSFNGRESDTRLLMWPLLFPFRYLGFDVLEPEILHGIGGVAFVEGEEGETSAVEQYRSRWAEQVNSLATRPSIPYNRDEDFDERKRLRPGVTEHSPFITHQSNVPWRSRSDT